MGGGATMGPVILPYRNILPRIDPSAFIAPGAIVIGDVEIGRASCRERV